MYGDVPLEPVKVITGDVPFLHTDTVPLILAVGNGFTVTVALLICACEQCVEVPSCTLTRLYTYDPEAVVGAVIVAVLLPVAVATV